MPLRTGIRNGFRLGSRGIFRQNRVRMLASEEQVPGGSLRCSTSFIRHGRLGSRSRLADRELIINAPDIGWLMSHGHNASPFIKGFNRAAQRHGSVTGDDLDVATIYREILLIGHQPADIASYCNITRAVPLVQRRH